MVIEGNLVLDGLLQDGIDGNQANAANGYEQLAISGSFTNNGNITVYADNSFTSSSFDSFKIIEFASKAGTGSIGVAASLNVQTFFDSNSLWPLPSTYATYTVTTTADSGAGSLRNAITQANAASTFALIAFAIPTSDSGYNSSTGVWTIALASALPGVSNPVLLDGTTQPGYAGKPLIDLSGTNAGAAASGLDLSASQSTIEGLAINNFQGDGIEVIGSGATGDTIAANYIGTDASGTTAAANGGNGILIEIGADYNTIGGTGAADRNIISGNSGDGVNINGAGTANNRVEGNDIGTDASGTTNLGNYGAGVVLGNGGSDNTIGGLAAGQGNTIAYNNSGAGVAVTGLTSSGDAIRGNLIYSNIGLGIDLGGTGTILANDSQGHSGPNNFASYPLINSVTAGPNTVVTGTLLNASTPATISYLDFYANTTQNPSGHGDAQVYLGSTALTTDSTGLATFSAAGLGATSKGQYVTVTATDQYGNTSEFALNTVPALADSPPSVRISGPTSMPASGIPIALGSNITDSQTGKRYTYTWNVTSTTDPSFALPTGAVTDEPNLTFTPSVSGTYVATLTVTDSLGGVGQAAPLTITVASGGQMVAIANSPASAAVGTPLTLTAAITEPPGVTVANYAWNVTLNGSAYTQNSEPTASTLTFTPATAGNYVVTLTATNSAGAAGSASGRGEHCDADGDG